jgi:hypothetical protein
VKSKIKGVAGPVSGNTRIDTKKLPADTKSKNAFQASAIKPAGGTRVPCPSASPNMRRFGIDIPCNDVRLCFVALHARTRRSTSDWVQHPEQFAGFIAVAERGKGNDRPRGSVGVLAAIFADARDVALDVAGVMVRMIERRREAAESIPPGLRTRLLLDSGHGALLRGPVQRRRSSRPRTARSNRSCTRHFAAEPSGVPSSK